MPTAVITGCGSGIGHAFAKILLEELTTHIPGYKVHALDNSVSDKLKALEGPNCKIAQVDVTSTESINQFKKTLNNEPIDILLNVAGIMPPKDKDTLERVELPSMQRTFATNTYGPLLLTQALLLNILAAAAPRRVAVVSSRVGSMGDNSSGGSYAYHASKSGVNSFFKSLAVDLKDKEVIVSVLHPGFTKTGLDPDIGLVKEVVEADVAAGGLWEVVKEKGMEETGKFWHRDGFELPW